MIHHSHGPKYEECHTWLLMIKSTVALLRLNGAKHAFEMTVEGTQLCSTSLTQTPAPTSIQYQSTQLRSLPLRFPHWRRHQVESRIIDLSEWSGHDWFILRVPWRRVHITPINCRSSFTRQNESDCGTGSSRGDDPWANNLRLHLNRFERSEGDTFKFWIFWF